MLCTNTKSYSFIIILRSCWFPFPKKDYSKFQLNFLNFFLMTVSTISILCFLTCFGLSFHFSIYHLGNVCKKPLACPYDIFYSRHMLPIVDPIGKVIVDPMRKVLQYDDWNIFFEYRVLCYFFSNEKIKYLREKCNPHLKNY